MRDKITERHDKITQNPRRERASIARRRLERGDGRTSEPARLVLCGGLEDKRGQVLTHKRRRDGLGDAHMPLGDSSEGGPGWEVVIS